MRVSIINLNLVGYDAIGQNILQQVRFFRRNGDDVRIFTLHPPEQADADVAALTSVVTVTELMAGRNAHFAQSDLYIYHFPGYYPLLDSMRVLDRGVVILNFHNVTPPDLWQSTPGDTVAAELTASLASIPRLAGFADLIVADSDYNAQQLIHEHGVEEDRIRVLPLPVPLDRFGPGPADPALLGRYGMTGKQVILFVGRMAGNKRVDLLVEALPLVQRQIPDAALLLAGDTTGNDSFRSVVAGAKARAAELGVADDVLFTGRVDDLAAHYRLARVYATASLHEGFGVPLLEAMASGVPVVASDATAHPALVGDAGLLAAPNDAAALAEQIIRVLDDDGLAGELVQAGLARAAEFSLDRYYFGWAGVVNEATQWLPGDAYPAPITVGGPRTTKRRQTIDVEMIGSLIDDDLRQLEARADTMQHGYVVRSQLPVVGPFLAWFRRNLTSHLREPYVDPTFERQELFNWQTVQTLQLLAAQIMRKQEAKDLAAAERITALEEQVQALRDEVAALGREQSD
ncbi:MAG: glycosyltransferase family 4 protein [Caldilineaceae bacterium]|nr:glycosyltransferase family 4 protein [Caldilineaceae bacterium]